MQKQAIGTRERNEETTKNRPIAATITTALHDYNRYSNVYFEEALKSRFFSSSVNDA